MSASASINKTSASGSLQGQRVVMLVWNGFVSDARVLREATSLAAEQAEVDVIAIITSARDVAEERIAPRVRAIRVARSAGALGRLVMAPRFLMRHLVSIVHRRLGTTPPEPFRGRPRWWQLDRRFVFLVAELAVNLRMFRHAASLRPTIIHAHDVNTLFPAWLAARRCRAKLVYDAHEISADREGYHGRVWLVKLVERFLGKAADGRITTTQARADWFKKEYGYPDMAVLQNRPVRRIVERSDRIRRTFGIAADSPVVLYQGGLQWGRGLRNLLEAVRGLPDAHLVFVGDGIQRASLEEEAAGMPGRVHFAGMASLDELPEWTASADVGVQCLRNTCLNHYTTDSNKLFEYVMGGLPVVASDFPEIRRIVEAYDLGILVDPDDVGAIRDALRKLLEDKAVRERFSANARRARDELDWTSQSSELLGLYGRLFDHAANR